MMTTSDALVAVAVSSPDREALEESRTYASTSLEQIRDLPCVSLEDEQTITELLYVVRQEIKDLDSKRTSITKPLNVAKRAVDALFYPALGPFKEAERILRDKLRSAAEAREASNRAALTEAMAASELPSSCATHLQRVDDSEGPDGVSYRFEWAFTVSDLDKVPREWLSVDHSAVKIYLRRYKDSEHVPEIPGLVFHKKATVVCR
jgi:hypothetical protein